MGPFKKYVAQKRGDRESMKKVTKNDAGGEGAAKKVMPLTQNVFVPISSAAQFSFLLSL